MGKTIDIGGRIHNPEVGNVVTGANEILDDTKNKKQDVINSEVDSALEALDANKQDNLTFDQTPTESSTNPVTSGGVYAADLALQQAIEAILVLIPSAATALNQLADKAFVNSTVATNTATFRGTYNVVTDLGLAYNASHQDIATALLSHIATADNNDYAFVQIPVSGTSEDIRVTERYKFNGTVWGYEYDLNNSGFTALQWAAINSGITALLVEKLSALPTAAELALALAGKQATLTFDNAPVSGSNNPVKSGGLYELFTAINAKFPANASSDNKLVAENRLAAYVTAIIGALDASFDLTSADGHVTFRMTQTNGVIASVQILTYDIASASSLTTLGGRVSTNETDIANLQAAYAGLTQSDVIVVNGALPSSGQQQNKIYRQPDQGHTPPQFYSDYMWNGSMWVLMATYNNAIDDEPIAGSNNLVKSGGVYSSIDEEKAIYDSDSDDDLDISDNRGNVLVAFKGGHIETKEFDSRNVSEKIVYNSDSESNLDISDDYGYVIAEFKGGHIRTKYFDSRNFAYLDLSGKNVLFFGDSITYYKEYVNSFSSKTGCTPYNRGLGSSCISNGGTGVPASFCSRVDMTPDNRQDGAGMAIGMPNNVDIDIVIIEGGINDFGYTNSGDKTAFLGDIGVADSLEIRQSFYGGVKYVISRIKTLYPNALVCVLGLIPTYSPSAFPNWSMVTLSDPSNILSTLAKKKTSEDKSWFDYNEALEVTAKQFGALFISLENMGMNPLIESDRIKYYKDGLHPNNTGGELIANKIINSIKNLKA